MNLKSPKLAMKGEYSATVLKADGTVKEFLNQEGTLKSGDVIKNRLLDNFFDFLTSVAEPLGTYPVSVRVGSGATAVVDTQTSLVNQLPLNTGAWPSNTGIRPAGVSVDGVFKASSEYTFTFATGQVTGNISELGVCFLNSTTTPTVHSRALVVDSFGSPATIAVGAGEQLILKYTLRMELFDADFIDTVSLVLNGEPQPVQVTTRRSASQALERYLSSPGSALYLRNGGLGQAGDQPGGTLLQGQTSFGYAYNLNGGKEATGSATSSQGNFAEGISVISFPFYPFKFGFNPPLPKNGDRILNITFRQTFGRLP